jgi:hypothetical protein
LNGSIQPKIIQVDSTEVTFMMVGSPPKTTRKDTASSSGASPGEPSKSRPRVLACTECSARKVKCDRNFPCGNCIKASKRCVPSTLTPRKRRRKVAERDLVERLHHYEGLLRQNKIGFEPLQQSVVAKPPASTSTSNISQKETTDIVYVRPPNSWKAVANVK